MDLSTIRSRAVGMDIILGKRRAPLEIRSCRYEVNLYVPPRIFRDTNAETAEISLSNAWGSTPSRPLAVPPRTCVLYVLLRFVGAVRLRKIRLGVRELGCTQEPLYERHHHQDGDHECDKGKRRDRPVLGTAPRNPS